MATLEQLLAQLSARPLDARLHARDREPELGRGVDLAEASELRQLERLPVQRRQALDQRREARRRAPGAVVGAVVRRRDGGSRTPERRWPARTAARGVPGGGSGRRSRWRRPGAPTRPSGRRARGPRCGGWMRSITSCAMSSASSRLRTRRETKASTRACNSRRVTSAVGPGASGAMDTPILAPPAAFSNGASAPLPASARRRLRIGSAASGLLGRLAAAGALRRRAAGSFRVGDGRGRGGGGRFLHV